MLVRTCDIYQRYGLPKDLQDHMLRATAIAIVLCDGWTGTPVNREDIVTTMIVHDIGNIAKMDFGSPEDCAKGKTSIREWRRMKERFIRSYGGDDHIATLNVARELGLSPRILWLVVNKIFIHNEMVASSHDYDLKICAYADQRAGPSGIVSLRARFYELRKRYRDKPTASINHPRSERLIESAYEIQRQVLKYTTLPPPKTAWARISRLMSELQQYQVQLPRWESSQ